MKKISSLLFTLFTLFTGYTYSQQTLPTDLNKLYEITDKQFVDLRHKPAPVIGVSASRGSHGGSIVSGTYIESILKAGGAYPLIIPVMTDGVVLRDIIKQIDGLVMVGGDDVNPSYYNEKAIPEINEIDSIRDVYDLVLLKLVTDRNIPVLGICRGRTAYECGIRRYTLSGYSVTGEKQ